MRKQFSNSRSIIRDSRIPANADRHRLSKASPSYTPTAIRAKKHLGQHFLTEPSVAERIAGCLTAGAARQVLEVGPGAGALTEFLLRRNDIELYAVEADSEAVTLLQSKFPALSPRLIHGDFLRINLPQIFPAAYCVIGNFPYNISSQILFRILEHREHIPEAVGMLQKEVAERISAKPGGRTYGILSVLLQAFYRVEYLFTVDADAFIPIPKVKSAVVRLERNEVQRLPCDEQLWKRIIKCAFNQRRKTLRNSLKPLLGSHAAAEIPMGEKRPEELGVEEFIALTNAVECIMKA